MYRYKIYGVILESEFKLNLLVPADESDDTRYIITVKESDIEEDVVRFLKDNNASKRRYEIGFEKSAFENQGGYFLIQGGKEILVKLKEGFTYETVSAWILGYSLSMALLQKGIMTIHCSALSTDHDAILISGTPGAGKSSLAGKLLENGLNLMADDVAGIHFENDACMVYPAFPFQKLCSNEIEKRGIEKNNLIYINEDKDKYLVPVKEIFESKPQKLKFFFFIVKAQVDQLTINQITGFDCFLAIRENLFLHRLIGGTWESQPQVINACMKIAASSKIYLIFRPENKDTLDELRDEIVKIIR